MKTTRNEIQLRKTVKRWILVFIVGLVLSGLTAFPIETQLAIANEHMSWLPNTL